MKESKQFANMVINNLTSASLPGLKLNKEYKHSSVPIIHVSELSLTSEGTEFHGKSWSTLLTGAEMKVGLFVLFYAPQSTFKNFNADEMLAGVIAPIGGIDQGKSQQSFYAVVSSHPSIEILFRIHEITDAYKKMIFPALSFDNNRLF